MLIWHLFYKAQMLIQASILQNSNTILAHISRSPILFWQLFTKKLKYSKAQVPSLAIFYRKPKYQLGKILQILKSPNTILATISKSPILFWQLFTKKTQILKSPITILGNILPKTQILVGQNFTNTQTPEYYSWQYFIESPNTIIGNILQKSNTILAISYQQLKTTTFLTNNYFIKAQILFGN